MSTSFSVVAGFGSFASVPWEDELWAFSLTEAAPSWALSLTAAAPSGALVVTVSVAFWAPSAIFSPTTGTSDLTQSVPSDTLAWTLGSFQVLMALSRRDS
ncbi:hypothetical protein [Kocuria rhizophila]|uniref:hypothetical protein n=1 Tax=Kocuria rhizophila TaxID=72000 RepID=UPI001D4DBE1E|nr:hypothetical protein [Kocuria rhizophila]MCC5672681.1 hypothetical protein [Kocuria rhizophila]